MYWWPARPGKHEPLGSQRLVDQALPVRAPKGCLGPVGIHPAASVPEEALVIEITPEMLPAHMMVGTVHQCRRRSPCTG